MPVWVGLPAVGLAELDQRERVFERIDEGIKAFVMGRELAVVLEEAVSVPVSRGDASSGIAAPKKEKTRDHKSGEPADRRAGRVVSVTNRPPKQGRQEPSEPAPVLLLSATVFHVEQDNLGTGVAALVPQDFGQLAIGLWGEMFLARKPFEPALGISRAGGDSLVNKSVEDQAAGRGPTLDIINQRAYRSVYQVELCAPDGRYLAKTSRL